MAKKVKVAKAAKVALPRPITSPYTSPFVTLHFGPNHQIYYLPEVLLQRLQNIPSRDPWKGDIHFVDVDASIGHVLIHFLHTGAYQTLNDEDVNGIDKAHSSIVRNEFQKAVLALEAAKKYSVPGLQKLAQIELERRGKDMSLREAVCAIREAFIAGPPGENAWLRDYVSKKVRWTFEHDLATLSAPDFFEIIESPTLTRLLAQIIVGLYSEEVDRLRKGKTATGKISTTDRSEPPGSCSPDLSQLPCKRIAAMSTAWPASVEKFGAFDDSVAAWDPQHLGQDLGSRAEASTPVTLSSCSNEEKEKDMLQTFKEVAEASLDNPPHHQPEIVLSSTDQATEHDTTTVEGLKQLTKEETTSPSATAMPVSPDNQLAELSKKQETKLEKKIEEETTAKEVENAESRKLEEGVAEVQHLQAEQTTIWQPQERDVAAASSTATENGFGVVPMWDNSGGLPLFSKKKRKKSKVDTGHLLPEPPNAPLPLMTPPPPASPPDIQLEVELTPVIADITTVAAIAPTVRQDPKAEVDPYAGLSRLKAKKLKSKLDREAKLKELEDAKRQNEEDEAAEIMRQEKEEAERMRLKEEEAEFRKMEEEAAAAAAEVSVNALDSAIKTGATFDGDDCQLRLEHLSRNDGWQNCKPCELYMRNIAIKLYSVGLPDVNEFSTNS